MSLMRLPRFHCYSPGGGEGPAGTPGHGGGMSSGPGSGGGGGGGGRGEPDRGMGMGQGGMMASNPGGFSDYGGGAIADLQGAIARGEEQAKAQAKVFSRIVSYIASKIPVVSSLVEIGKLALDIQQDLGVNVTPEQVNGVLNGLKDGRDPEDISRGLRNDLGIYTPQEKKEVDPKSDAFWEQFVNEFKEAKANIKANDQFRKDKLKPAFDTYQNRLAGLSNEPGFAPINVKFGDFSTSFNTRRSTENAQNILSSELAETDVMQPKRAETSYLSQLYDVAKWQQEMKNKINLTENSERPDDQGSWLDIINDTIKVAKSGKDLYDMFSN